MFEWTVNDELIFCWYVLDIHVAIFWGSDLIGFKTPNTKYWIPNTMHFVFTFSLYPQSTIHTADWFMWTGVKSIIVKYSGADIQNECDYWHFDITCSTPRQGLFEIWNLDHFVHGKFYEIIKCFKGMNALSAAQYTLFVRQSALRQPDQI